MKKSCIGLLIAALGVIPEAGFAQVKVGAKAEAEATIDADAEGADAKAAGAVEGDAKVEGGEGADLATEDEGVGDICKIDPAACPVLDMKKEAARPIKESIYAVQQLYVMRARRFEFVPWWNVSSLNDQFVQHQGPGVAINYYITNVLAVGVNFRYYDPFNRDSDFNGQVRRAARVAVPLNEYQWGASLDFYYVFANGKFAGFGDFIFEYDAYLLGGVGALSTRPIAVIDPDFRNFKYKPKLAFDLPGLGLRIFFARWFAFNAAVKNYIYNEELENLSTSNTNPSDESTWLDKKSITNNVELQLGLSLFVPFSFDYRLPK